MAGNRAAQAATKEYVVLAEQVNQISDDGEQLAFKRGERIQLTDAHARRLGVDARQPRDRMVARPEADAPEAVTEPTAGSGLDPASAANGAGGQLPGAAGPAPDADGATAVPADGGTAAPDATTAGGGTVKGDGVPTNAS